MQSLLWFITSDSGLLSLQLAWKPEKKSTPELHTDHAASIVAAKTVEPSVIDFDKINSRFMMFRQQNRYGFVVADDFAHLS